MFDIGWFGYGFICASFFSFGFVVPLNYHKHKNSPFDSMFRSLNFGEQLTFIHSLHGIAFI